MAFAVHSNPGAYALLLGAGVSAPSVHTAWHVLEDLCRKVALLQAADPGDDATQWYEQHFDTEPQYGTLLEKLARTRTERQRLLAGYFEPTAEDVEAGRKVPTRAHDAIARLVLAGSVRVIVTLNFDRLMEQALRAAGVEPTVAATPADIEGLAPLHTLKCVVIHLNGDYLSPTSMLNTESELDTYDNITQALLERVLTDYGLIVAGWSAKYDTHLRNTISRVYPSRYTLTWIDPFEPNDIARELGTRTNAVYLTANADTAFGTLRDAVESLTVRSAAHPLTVPVAVETAKRELAGHTVAIGLHDRLNFALGALQAFPDFHLPDYHAQLDYPAMVARIEEASKLTTALVATLAYWGNDDTDQWWVDELQRFTYRPPVGGLTRLLDIRRIAGTSLLYAAAVSAVAKKRWSLLARLLDVTVPNPQARDQVPLDQLLTPWSAYQEEGHFAAFPGRLISELTGTLTLGRPAVDGAWQTFEVVKLGRALMRKNGFTERAEVLTKSLEPRRGPRRTTAEQQRQLEEDFATSAVMHELAVLVPRARPHVLVEDRGVDVWGCAVALNLARELDDVGDTHPLVQAGVLPGSSRGNTSLALRAVSHSLGKEGNRLAWDTHLPDGSIAMRMWLDTRTAPTGE